jgi:D-glycero-D-manno-heptose 1,7-bisphosphate phosphatase
MHARYVILDRDGTVIQDCNYLTDPQGVELLPGAAEGLRQIAALGWGLVVITNQSGIGRGFLDHERLRQIHDRLRDVLAGEGVALDGIYYCPHAPDDNCACRKPLPGLLLRAASELHFDPAACVVVGDKACDVELGKGVGAVTILIKGADPEAQFPAPDYTVGNLVEAAQIIEKRLNTGKSVSLQRAERQDIPAFAQRLRLGKQD